MCGIAGIFRLTRSPTADDVSAVLSMLEAQLHRGPDDCGLLMPEPVAFSDRLSRLRSGIYAQGLRTYPSTTSRPGAVLGTRRLSIIDRSARGHMPMGDAEGRVWITYNGETYNYRELRAELRSNGDLFVSETDTEAVLRGYKKWGLELPSHLRGMFAFAIFETGPIPRVVLARDHFGIKPLYYYHDRERLVFASEVRALLRSGLVPDEPNATALVRFLQLGSVPVPETTVRNIHALPAGHSLIVEQGSCLSRRYWDLAAHLGRRSNGHSRASRQHATAVTRALLEDSVKHHLISDVPLGVFLSGGVDSSALVALASQLQERPPITLSIVFEEERWSEARYARLMADRYGTDHREVVVTSQDLVESLPRIFADMDQPTVDGVNAYFISMAAREAGLTVVLSGTGGDEVFLGYDHLRKARSYGVWRNILRLPPPGARRRVVAGAIRLGQWAGRSGAERLGYLEEPTAEHAYLVFRGLFGLRQIAELLGMEERELALLGSPRLAGSETQARSLLDFFILLEFRHYLQNQLLKDTDAMSMAHSVEARVPYLDHLLVEHVLGLPREFKLEAGRPKALLLDVIGEAIPREVWDRPKMGFTFPFEPWLRQWSEELEPSCLEANLLQRTAVADVWRRFRTCRLHWSRAWALVVLSRFNASRKERTAA